MVMLGKQCGNGQTHIAGARNGNVVGAEGLFGFGGGTVSSVDIQVGHLKAQNLGNGFQLIGGGLEGLIFQSADHGTVDAGQFGKLDLGDVFCLSLLFNGFRQKAGG